MNATQTPQAIAQRSPEDERVYETHRRWGYLAANLDPLGFLQPITHPELIVEGPAAAAARKFYCGTIGSEFEHIDDPQRRRWITDRLESAARQSALRMTVFWPYDSVLPGYKT